MRLSPVDASRLSPYILRFKIIVFAWCVTTQSCKQATEAKNPKNFFLNQNWVFCILFERD